MALLASEKSRDGTFLYNPYAGNNFGRLNGRTYPCARVNVDLEKLHGLARFLAENVPATNNHRSTRVVCWSGETAADLMRREFPDGKFRGHTPVENVIRAYNLEAEAAIIEDWLFPLILAGETGEEYYQRAADEMRSAGVEMVKVRPPMGEEVMYFV